MSSKPLPPSLFGMAKQNDLNKDLIAKDSPRTRRRNQERSCCRRFCNEFALTFFQDADYNGRKLDLIESFCAERTNWIRSITKILLWAITVYTYIVGWFRNREDVEFYLAYLTNWALTFAVLYMTLSLLNTWCCNSLMLIKAAWIMYSVAAVYEVAVAILFWAVEYDPNKNVMDYYTIASHGGITLVVIFEGTFINHVPVRLKHYIVIFGIAILYLTWTIIQNLVLKYNPNADDDDVAIYDVLKWGNDPVMAGIVAALIVFVFLPIDQLIVWAISLPGRRYRQSEDSTAWDRSGIETV